MIYSMDRTSEEQVAAPDDLDAVQLAAMFGDEHERIAGPELLCDPDVAWLLMKLAASERAARAVRLVVEAAVGCGRHFPEASSPPKGPPSFLATDHEKAVLGSLVRCALHNAGRPLRTEEIPAATVSVQDIADTVAPFEPDDLIDGAIESGIRDHDRVFWLQDGRAVFGEYVCDEENPYGGWACPRGLA